MVLYRSEADLDYTDQITRPTDRAYGSNRSDRPDVFNLEPEARTRSIRPDVFLSTMSGPASRARLHENIKKVTVPTLVLVGTADRGTYVWEQEKTYESAGAKDKSIVKIEGADHAWSPSGPKAGDGKQRERMLDALFAWVGKRFPSGGTNYQIASLALLRSAFALCSGAAAALLSSARRAGAQAPAGDPRTMRALARVLADSRRRTSRRGRMAAGGGHQRSDSAGAARRASRSPSAPRSACCSTPRRSTSARPASTRIATASSGARCGATMHSPTTIASRS